jgi:hypothetical protein
MDWSLDIRIKPDNYQISIENYVKHVVGFPVYPVLHKPVLMLSETIANFQTYMLIKGSIIYKQWMPRSFCGTCSTKDGISNRQF